MTDVRRRGHRRPMFKTERRKGQSRQARLHTQRPREDAARSIPRPGLDTYVFSGSDLKSYSAAVAAGISFGVVVERVRALSEVISRMQTGTSAHGSEDDVQLRLYSPVCHPSPSYEQEGFDAFDGSNFQASNGKPRDGKGVLTHLTDLTVSERGVYVASARPPALARPLGCLLTPSTTAVKSVKSVKPQDGEGWFSPPCRQTGCQFDGSATSGVVA